MAISIAHRAQVVSTSNTTSYATSGTYTPGANSLLVVAVCSVIVGGTGETPNSMTGHGLTFSTALTLGTSTFTQTGNTFKVTVYVQDAGGSPSSTAVTAGFASTHNACSIHELEVTGWDTSGGAAGAIVQNPTNTGSDASLEVTLASAGSSDNRPITFGFQARNAGAFTVDGDWSLGHSAAVNSPSVTAGDAFRNDAFDTTMTFTSDGVNPWLTVGLEIKAAGGGVVFTPRLPLLGVG